MSLAFTELLHQLVFRWIGVDAGFPLVRWLEIRDVDVEGSKDVLGLLQDFGGQLGRPGEHPRELLLEDVQLKR